MWLPFIISHFFLVFTMQKQTEVILEKYFMIRCRLRVTGSERTGNLNLGCFCSPKSDSAYTFSDAKKKYKCAHQQIIR